MSSASLAAAAAARLESEFVSHLSSWKLVQQDLDRIIQARQTCESQREELELLLSEFEHLEAEAQLYKMIGPILQPIEKTNSIQQVTKKLQYVKEEAERCAKREKHLAAQQKEKKQQVSKSAQKRKDPNHESTLFCILSHTNPFSTHFLFHLFSCCCYSASCLTSLILSTKFEVSLQNVALLCGVQPRSPPPKCGQTQGWKGHNKERISKIETLFQHYRTAPSEACVSDMVVVGAHGAANHA